MLGRSQSFVTFGPIRFGFPKVADLSADAPYSFCLRNHLDLRESRFLKPVGKAHRVRLVIPSRRRRGDPASEVCVTKSITPQLQGRPAISR